MSCITQGYATPTFTFFIGSGLMDEGLDSQEAVDDYMEFHDELDNFK